MEIKKLQFTKLESIFDAFREAFLNYFVPFTGSFEDTKKRWERAGVNLNFSYGAFDGDKLVAFILNAEIDSTLYNFAMGVIPSHRGLHLIEKIFHELPKNHERFVLEVITENEKAINLYTKLGYRKVRALDSFQGVLNLPAEKMTASYDVTDYSDIDGNLRWFYPSSESRIQFKVKHLCETHTLKVDGRIKAYAHFIPETLSLKEVGALEDKFLDRLLFEMKLNGEKLRLMNIETSSRFIGYLEARGMQKFIGQFEMEYDLGNR